MGKPKRDDAALREAWIQERLGERKDRQLRMHQVIDDSIELAWALRGDQQ